MNAPSKIWFYTDGKDRFGPFDAMELRDLALHEKIDKNSLIWKEGLADWVSATAVKGLLAAETTMQPPPIAGNSQATKQPPVQQQPKEHEKSFWNPLALSNWSFFLGPEFGAFLVAKNYETLGHTKERKKAMDWFYASLASYVALATLVYSHDFVGLTIYGFFYIAFFLVWNFKSARRQNRILVDLYGKKYPRNEWGKALLIGFLFHMFLHMLIYQM